MSESVRWEQRFSNYKKALSRLKQAVEYIQMHRKEAADNSILNEIVREGVIQRFEYTQELAWKVMKDYAEYQGNDTLGGSRDAIREAFYLKLIVDAHVWMDMIVSRNKSSHTYNEDTAVEICNKVTDTYYPAFVAFEEKMDSKVSNLKGGIFDH